MIIKSICSERKQIHKGTWMCPEIDVVDQIGHLKGKSKGKAIPLQTWTGPEGSRRLRLPDFKTIGT
jgi:hypothetical protein